MNLVLAKHFNFSPEAELAKERLEMEGIKGVIQKAGSFMSPINLIGEADLFVQEEDLKKAQEIIGIQNSLKSDFLKIIHNSTIDKIWFL